MSVVYPIMPFYDKNEELDFEAIKSYLLNIDPMSQRRLMTTAGTSQFNFLETSEILALNNTVLEHNPNAIIGLPAKNLRKTKQLIENCYAAKNIILIYPDRYYSEEHYLGYFKDILGSFQHINFYIHAAPIRYGPGGNWQINHLQINDLINHCPNFVGIKEECSTIDEAYNLCRKITPEYPNFDIIVAGGSIRRFKALEGAGVKSFLAGVGSVFPKYDEELNLDVENEWFDIFMPRGWHRCLRFAIQYNLGLEYNNRKPWPEVFGTNSITDLVDKYKC